MIIPYLSYYQSKAEQRDSNGKITKLLPGYENWFFVSRKKSPAMTAWLRNFEKLYSTPFEINFKE